MLFLHAKCRLNFPLIGASCRKTEDYLLCCSELYQEFTIQESWVTVTCVLCGI